MAKRLTKAQRSCLMWMADQGGYVSIFGRRPRGVGFGVVDQCAARGWVEHGGRMGFRRITPAGRAALEEADSDG